MARSNENVIFCSIRMYLNNPQHFKIAKVLKKGEEEKDDNNGLTKNQFVLDAVEYYIDHYYMAEEDQAFVTRKDLLHMKQEIQKELQSMLRMGWLQPYPAVVPAIETPAVSREEHTEESPDDTLMDLVSDWD